MSGIYTVIWIDREFKAKFSLRKLHKEIRMLYDARCTGVVPSPWKSKPGIVCFFRDEKTACHFVSNIREASGEPLGELEKRGDNSVYLVPRRTNAITVSALRSMFESKNTDGNFFDFVDQGIKPRKEFA